MSISSASPLSRLLRPDAGWRLSVCPAAGEAGGSFAYSVRQKPEYVPPGAAADPGRARAEAARRARGQVRRYCAGNGLNRLGTLTYRGEGCHDPRRVRVDLGDFFRSLRGALGGEPMPYVWVPEWHPGGHGLHAHFAVGRYVPRSVIEAAWGRGFVHIKRLGDLPAGSGALAQARASAGYLSKYVSKTFDHVAGTHLGGLHRYEVAQGFQPTRVQVSGRSAGDVRDQACAMFGGVLPARSWASADVEGWSGPPAVWFQWD